MEELAVWYSFAKRVCKDKDFINKELERAEEVLGSLNKSVRTSQDRLIEMLNSEKIPNEEVNLQAQHLHLLERVFYRKKTALVKDAVSHCIHQFRRFKLLGKYYECEDLQDRQKTAQEILSLIESESENNTAALFEHLMDLKKEVEAFFKTHKQKNQKTFKDLK